MKKDNPHYQRRSQKNYTLGFKLSVIAQVEKGEMTYKQAQKRYGIQGRSTVLVWLRKHGSLDWSNPSIHFRAMPHSKETPAQKIKRLEKELEDEKLKNYILTEAIKTSDEKYGTSLRKKLSPKRSENSNKKKK